MIFIVIAAIVIYFYFDKRKYDRSLYKSESGISYLKAKLNIGYHGEYLSFSKLELIEGYHKTLVNVYIPKDEKETTEIDLLYIHKTGIYVLESKNYSGWIFGNEKNKYWRQTFKTGRKEQFYNPIRQNKTHIKYLSKFLEGIDTNCYLSLIVFSERCTLKKIEIQSENVKVIKRYDLVKVLKKIIEGSEQRFSQEEIDSIYYKLKPLTNVSEAIKLQHISNINTKINQ